MKSPLRCRDADRVFSPLFPKNKGWPKTICFLLVKKMIDFGGANGFTHLLHEVSGFLNIVLGIFAENQWIPRAS